VSNVPSADLLVIQLLSLEPAEYFAAPSWVRAFLVELLLGGGA
jgi:hypothetical protein